MADAQTQLDSQAIKIAVRAENRIENHEAICAVKHDGIQKSLTRIENKGNTTLWLLITGLLAIIAAFVQGIV